MEVDDSIVSALSELEELSDQQKYLENYSRRNNLKNLWDSREIG